MLQSMECQRIGCDLLTEQPHYFESRGHVFINININNKF